MNLLLLIALAILGSVLALTSVLDTSVALVQFINQVKSDVWTSPSLKQVVLWPLKMHAHSCPTSTTQSLVWVTGTTCCLTEGMPSPSGAPPEEDTAALDQADTKVLPVFFCCALCLAPNWGLGGEPLVLLSVSRVLSSGSTISAWSPKQNAWGLRCRNLTTEEIHMCMFIQHNEIIG